MAWRENLEHDVAVQDLTLFHRRALELHATAVIMVHNHPSGDPTPSKTDIKMTHELRDIGESLGIRLHDHVIVARGGHSSFKEMGLL